MEDKELLEKWVNISYKEKMNTDMSLSHEKPFANFFNIFNSFNNLLLKDITIKRILFFSGFLLFYSIPLLAIKKRVCLDSASIKNFNENILFFLAGGLGNFFFFHNLDISSYNYLKELPEKDKEKKNNLDQADEFFKNL